jgi:hypothetical protein
MWDDFQHEGIHHASLQAESAMSAGDYPVDLGSDIQIGSSENRLREHVASGTDSEWQDVEVMLNELDMVRATEQDLRQTTSDLAGMRERLLARIEQLHGRSAVAEAGFDNIRLVLKKALSVLEYVSRGRGFVDVEKYPDVTARMVLGLIDDEV